MRDFRLYLVGLQFILQYSPISSRNFRRRDHLMEVGK